jgi:RNA polymerase sigma factor (sigma-70 family)
MGAQPSATIDRHLDRQSISPTQRMELRVATTPDYEYRLTAPAHLQQIAQIARKQTRGSSVDWQDALQAAQIKLILAIRAGKFTHGTAADFDRWAATVARCEIIDLVRKAKCRDCESTDRLLTDNLTMLDTIADPCDLLDSLTTADLVLRVRAAIVALDRRYPDRSYARLWLGKVNDLTQTELARELSVTQSAISKRWQELLARLAVELDLDRDVASDRTRSVQDW